MFSIFSLGGLRSEFRKWVLIFSFCFSCVSSLMLRLHKLIHAVYADYARGLKLLGFRQGAIFFASKAGEAGKDLLVELKQPKGEATEE